MRNLIEQHHSLDDILSIVRYEFVKACTAKRHPFKYVVLSTCASNIVQSRYVVLRKFLENNRFLIFTDARTSKITDLQKNNNCNLLFYHTGKSVQVRVDATVVIHQNTDISKHYWNGVKNHGYKSYTSIVAPGTKITQPAEAYDWDEQVSDDHFVVLEVIPSSMEVLQLNRDYHSRALFDVSDSNVIGTFLAP